MKGLRAANAAHSTTVYSVLIDGIDGGVEVGESLIFILVLRQEGIAMLSVAWSRHFSDRFTSVALGAPFRYVICCTLVHEHNVRHVIPLNLIVARAPKTEHAAVYHIFFMPMSSETAVHILLGGEDGVVRYCCGKEV